MATLPNGETPSSPVWGTKMFWAKTKEIPFSDLPAIDPLTSTSKLDYELEAVENYPLCPLITKDILHDTSESYQVKTVQFKIKSHDQGWCNEDNFDGDYQGSWTWFEAAILRRFDQVDANIRNHKDIDAEPCICSALAEQKIEERGMYLVYNDVVDSHLWHIQRNVRGQEDPKEHTITWNEQSVESEDEKLGWGFDSATGAGSGYNFVSSLRKGDRIAVIARAKQSGSVNYICSVEAKITYGPQARKLTVPADTIVNVGSEASKSQSKLSAVGDDSDHIGPSHDAASGTGSIVSESRRVAGTKFKPQRAGTPDAGSKSGNQFTRLLPRRKSTSVAKEVKRGKKAGASNANPDNEPTTASQVAGSVNAAINSAITRITSILPSANQESSVSTTNDEQQKTAASISLNTANDTTVASPKKGGKARALMSKMGRDRQKPPPKGQDMV